MSSENLPDWLPAGWTVQVKDNGVRKVKYYCNMETGQKFYTQEDVIRYVKMRCFSSPQAMMKNNRSRKKTNHKAIVMKKNENPEWLPHNWIMELKTRESGTKCKCYIDPESGRKFYSKQQVSGYLETVNSSKTTEKRHNDDGITGDKSSSEPDAFQRNEVNKSSSELAVSQRDEVNKSSSEPDDSQRNEVSEWLPHGWIVELKTQKSGKKFKCYIDPENGRKFFSKPEVSRYLESLESRTASEWKSHNKDVLTGNKSSLEPVASQRNEVYKSSSEPDMSQRSEVNKSSSEPDVSQRNEVNKSSSEPDVSERNEVNKSSSDPDVPQRNEVSEWLPSGWIVEVKAKSSGKKYKCYIDPESGRKFFSKPEVSRYLESLDRSTASDMKSHNVDHMTGDKSSSEPSMLEQNEISEWLPHGWTMELKTTRSGQKYKCYIEPESGRKFYSKREVSSYLETINSCAASEKGIVGNVTGDGSSSEPGMSQRSEVPNWLPDGWILEVKTRETGTRIGMRFKCFTDPKSGRKFFSKPQVLQYLASINSSTIGREKDTVGHLTGDKASSEPEQSLQISIRKKARIGKHSVDKVISRTLADGLPPGWIKEIRLRNSAHGIMKDPYYTDPLSGYIFRSKLDALRYLNTGDIANCAIKPKKRDINMNEDSSDTVGHLTGDKASSEPEQSLQISTQKKARIDKYSVNKVISRTSADGLPPGWIKEIRVRKSANGIMKDPYYTDPLSGYMFRSKLDALRYLNTGDIANCAIKPKKRDSNINEDISSVCAVDEQKLVHSTTRRQLFAGKEGCDTISLAASEAENSKETHDNNISPDAVVVSIPTSGNLIKENPRGSVNENRSKTEDNTDLEIKSSEFAKNNSVSTPATDILQEAILPDNGMEKHSNRKIQAHLNKSKNKTESALPGRSSKRLKGLAPEIRGESSLNERAIRAAARGVPQQFEAELERERNKNKKPLGDKAIQDKQPGSENKNEKPLGHKAIQDEQPGSENTEKQNVEKTELREPEFSYPLGDSSWTDPCLEFAVKTLTGEIPVEDNLAIEEIFQQSDSSENQTNQKGNVSLPGCSSIGPQQCSLEIERTNVK